MSDISGYGFRLNLISTTTFPVGFDVTAFADDADPIDFPELTVAEAAMGLNGDLVSWSTANPVPITISIIPNSSDDINLGLLAEATRVGKGKLPGSDSITMVGVYPNGATVTLTNGIVTNFLPANPISSAGRIKSKVYKFTFENILYIPIPLT
tara:strand:+ start:51 stop:509 length:459 start_codon:yes stop_codon:yes gene_type:complete